MYALCIQTDRVSYLFAVVDVLVAKNGVFVWPGVRCVYIRGFGCFPVVSNGPGIIFYNFEVLHV